MANAEDKKRHYNTILKKIIELEAAGDSGRAYQILVESARQLLQSIASADSIFDIDTPDAAIDYLKENKMGACISFGFEVGGEHLPFCTDEKLRSKLIGSMGS